MSRLDVVVFGATGFTGKHAVGEVARLAQKYNFTWGVAGRSESKLQTVMQEVSKKSGDDLSSTKLIIADVSDENSLREMCRQAVVVVNCCGPYRLYGEPVVRAAVESRTHLVDVSGEPQFIETMQLKYNEAAKEANVFVVSACGFDSVPNDMGVAYLTRQFPGTLNSVESYLTTVIPPKFDKGAKINYGTWESLVYGLSHHSELAPLRKKIYPDRLPTFLPKLASRGIHKLSGKWYIPFLGADSSIVYRSQRAAYTTDDARPVQFKPYVRIGGFGSLVASLFAGAMLFLLSKTSFTRRLLLDHPRLFSLGFVSRDGPTQDVMDNSYYKFELRGEGWKRGQDEGGKTDTMMTVKVSGLNPGYGATVSSLVYCAIAILRNRDKMPQHGGVMTTAQAFGNTELVANLTHDARSNMKFEVIEAPSAM